jgi:tRNA-2-methylthio-N6-dimethylallyladenosine synthase
MSGGLVETELGGSRFTFFNKVFGCQMNVSDCDDIAARLSAHGGQEVDNPFAADLVLVNTCTVRQKAEEKAYSYFGQLKHAGQVSGRRPFIVGMGCVVPKNRQHIAEKFPHVDLLVNYSDPDVVLNELVEHFTPLTNHAFADGFTPLADPNRCQQSFVTAIRGCNHRCSFCIVPWARGPQRDVPLEQIVVEAQAHERSGAPDVCILGQSVMAYGKTSGDGSQRFSEMIEAVLENTSFRWVGFLTSLACDLTEDICERVIAHPRVTPLLHLPLQSGSDKVLSEMRRQHDMTRYRRLVAKAREVRPDLYLTTDLLVGFPTETDADFEQTLEAATEIGFDDAFMFAYSERPGTHSARVYHDTDLPREVKIGRLSRLIAQQRQQSAERSRRYIGQELEAIVEQREAGGGVARTAFNKPVKLAACHTPVGQFIKVKITDVKVSSFIGEELSGFDIVDAARQAQVAQVGLAAAA